MASAPGEHLIFIFENGQQVCVYGVCHLADAVGGPSEPFTGVGIEFV